jgi:hypothetical protein
MAESRHFNKPPMHEGDLDFNASAVESCRPGPGCEVYTRIMEIASIQDSSHGWISREIEFGCLWNDDKFGRFKRWMWEVSRGESVIPRIHGWLRE